MADHGEVKIRDFKLNNLIQTYKSTLKGLTTTITDATDAGKFQKARTMAQVRKQLDGLGQNVDAFVKKEIPQYYQDGAAVAIQDLKKIGADVTKGTSVLDTQAIAALVDEVNNAFAESITTMGRSASKVLSSAQKQQIQMTIAEGKISGESVKTIADSVKQQLQDNGISALVDKSGRSWSFDDYASMLVRTKGVEARNQGLANRMLSSGYDLVQVSDHNSDHPACAVWEGKILSLTGKTPGYPTVSEATQAGLFHPNCQHAINVINVQLAQETQAYDNPYNNLSPEEKAASDASFAARGPLKAPALVSPTGLSKAAQDAKDREIINQELSDKAAGRSTSEVKIELAINKGDFKQAQTLVDALPDTNPSKASNQSLIDLLGGTSLNEEKGVKDFLNPADVQAAFDLDKYQGGQALRNATVASRFNAQFPDLNGFTDLYDWKIEQVPISSLETHAAANADTVAQYAKDFQKGDVFPTIMAVSRDGSLDVLDGAHRIEAVQSLGVTKIDVLVGIPKKKL